MKPITRICLGLLALASLFFPALLSGCATQAPAAPVATLAPALRQSAYTFGPVNGGHKVTNTYSAGKYKVVRDGVALEGLKGEAFHYAFNVGPDGTAYGYSQSGAGAVSLVWLGTSKVPTALSGYGAIAAYAGGYVVLSGNGTSSIARGSEPLHLLQARTGAKAIARGIRADGALIGIEQIGVAPYPTAAWDSDGNLVP